MAEILTIKDSFQSTNKKNTIVYRVYSPTTTPKAVVQFCHGMAEHAKRYEAFGTYLAQNGIAFCINDHLGHGESVQNENQLGYFGEKHGWKLLVSDAEKLTYILKKKYPNVPFIIAGHSMGSFVVRAYLSMYKDLADGAVIIGTGNATSLIKIGESMAKAVALFKGKQHHSKWLDNMSFASYNERISNAVTPFDWLSRDAQNVKLYIDDPLCGFIFTTSGFADISSMIKFVSTKKWADSINKKIPILLTSGDADPVGGYGELVTKVYNMLKSSDVNDVTLKLYEGARHEILNETNRQEVYEDMLKWLMSKVL